MVAALERLEVDYLLKVPAHRRMEAAAWHPSKKDPAMDMATQTRAFVLTNLEAIHTITAWWRYNAGAVVEQRIEELGQLGMGATAIDDLDGKALLWSPGALAYQLVHTIRRELLSGPWKVAQPKRVRLWVFRVPGNSTRSGRKSNLQLVGDHPWRAWLLAALLATQTLRPLPT